MRAIARAAAVAAIGGLVAGTSASADTFDVLNTGDSGFGSLRKAIGKANSDPAKDKIDIQAVGAVQLQSALPDLSTDLVIAGPGRHKFAVKGKDGGDYRIFTVTAGVRAKVSGLTAAHGSLTGGSVAGGGILNQGNLRLNQVGVTGNSLTASSDFNASANGGGISNTGTLLLRTSVVKGNTATAASTGPMDFAQTTGGGIESSGELTVIDSTVAGNQLVSPSGFGSANGGGIFSSGTADVTASTISGNSAGSTGASGGLENRTPGMMHLTNTTVAGNSAQFAGGLDNQQGTMTVASSTIAGNSSSQAGANLTNADGGPLDLRNTILASPVGGAPDCAIYPTFTDAGFNLDSDGSCPFTEASSQSSADPHLLDLAKNGGPTQTMALGQGSDAIDQGMSFGLTMDQRGLPRPVDLNVLNADGGDSADIGAFEKQRR